jgi:hypothetical protein
MLAIAAFTSDLAEWILWEPAVRHIPHLVRARPYNLAAISSTIARRSFYDATPVAIVLQHLQGEGIGFYLAVPSLHLPRLTKVVESLVRYQEYQYLVFAPKL